MKNKIITVIILFTLLSLFLASHQIIFSSESHVKKNAEKIVTSCKDSKRNDFCYTDKFTAFVKKNDLTSSIALLRTVQEEDTNTNNCHFLAHVIAYEELQKNPDTWEDLFKKVPVDSCTGGYLMGILEGYQYKNKTVLNARTLPEICDRISRSVERQNQISPESSCVHIMGHLILTQENGNIDKSLDTCSTLEKTSHAECFAGVFMESIIQRNIVLHNGGEPLVWTQQTTQSQQDKCTKYDGLIALACWRELSHMYVFLEKSYPPAVHEDCQKAPTTSAQEECYVHGVGIMSVSSRFKKEYLTLLCEPYNKEGFMGSCISIVIDTLIGSSVSLANNAAYFCQTVPDEHQRFCYNRLGVQLAIHADRSTREKVCKNIPSSYHNTCLGT